MDKKQTKKETDVAVPPHSFCPKMLFMIEVIKTWQLSINSNINNQK